MNEVNPDNAARATPVAWVERTEGGLTRMWSGDLSAWAHRPANPEPLYSAATVAALEAEVERLRTALGCVAWTRKPGPIPSRVPGSVVEQMERIAINALTGARAK